MSHCPYLEAYSESCLSVSVHVEIKPDLSKQVPDNVPSSIKNKALNKCKETVVAPMVNKSIDKVSKCFLRGFYCERSRFESLQELVYQACKSVLSHLHSLKQ